MIDAKKRGRERTIKEDEASFLGKNKIKAAFDDDEEDDDEDEKEKEKKRITKKKSKDNDEDSKKKSKKNKSEKKKKGKEIKPVFQFDDEGEDEEIKPKKVNKKQKKESQKKNNKLEGPKYVDFDVVGENIRENKEKEEEEDREIEKQKEEKAKAKAKAKEKAKKQKQKKIQKEKEKEKEKKLKAKPSSEENDANNKNNKKNDNNNDDSLAEENRFEDNDVKKFKELQELANKDIEKKVEKEVVNEHDKDPVDESYYYNAELDTTPPNPNAHSGPNEGILADGTFNSKEDLEEIAKNLEKENKNLEAINHRNSLNNIKDKFSKNNVQNPVISDIPPAFSETPSLSGNEIESGNQGIKESESSPEDGWSDLGGLEKVEEIEKEDQLNRENNPNQKSTEEEYPDLQLEREQVNLKENSRFKYFKLTPDQEKRAKDLIDNGFEMLNTSTLFQISFRTDSADKQSSELCVFKLDEKSTQNNENRSHFAKLDSLLQLHFTEEKRLKDGLSLTLPKTKCYDKLEIDSHVDGQFSKINFQIFNPQPCSDSSSFVLQTSKAFYVVPLSFKKQLAVTLTYLPQTELDEILSDGFRTFFLDDNKFIEVLSSYWLIQTV